MTGITLKKNMTRVLLFAVMIIIAFSTLFASSSYAITGTPIYLDTKNKVDASYRLKTGYNNYEVVQKSSLVEIKAPDGLNANRSIVIKMTESERKKGKTFTNPITLKFTNAGKIGGRSVDVIIKVTELNFSPRAEKSNEDKTWVRFGAIKKTSFWFNNKSDYYPFHAKWTGKCTISVVWSGTSTIVPYAMFMQVRDLDAPTNPKNTKYYKEAWKAGSGFTGTFIFYKQTEVIRDFSQSLFKSIEKGLTDTEDEQIKKAGLYAPTQKGKAFSSTFYEGYCGTGVEIFCQEADNIAPKPTKTQSRSTAYEGDYVTYTIKQDIGNYFVDTIKPYDDFAIVDELEDVLKPTKASITNKNGTVVGSCTISSDGTVTNTNTTAGQFVYSKGSNTLRFNFNSNYHCNSSGGYTDANYKKYYDGSTYTLKITAKIKDIPDSKASLTVRNTAKVDFGTSEHPSPSTSLTVYNKAGVVYRYKSGTQGKNLPPEISTTSGEFAISDDESYQKGDVVTRKSSPAKGAKLTVYEGGLERGTWTLESWDKKSATSNGKDDVVFTGTWVYKEIPWYHATYSYKSGTPGKALPSEISTTSGRYAVSDSADYLSGQTVTRQSAPVEGAKHYVFDENENPVGVWVLSWDAATRLVEDADVEFEGTWRYKAMNEYGVNYKYVSGTEGRGLPAAISTTKGAYAVSDETLYPNGTVVAIADERPEVGTAYIIKNDRNKEIGRWTLVSWDKLSDTINNDDITFTGTWVYTEKNWYVATYEYISGTEGRTLPAAISTTDGDYAISDDETYENGSTVNRKPTPADGTVYRVSNSKGEYRGKWTLTWDKSSEVVNNADVHFVGTWVFTAPPKLKIVKKIEDIDKNYLEANGVATFIFKITGNGNTMYKTISLTDELVKNGSAKSPIDGSKVSRSGNTVTASQEFIVDEANFTVEELDAIRYELIDGNSKYYDGTDIGGLSGHTLSAPLASANKDGVVCTFENEKNVFPYLTHGGIVINKLAAVDEIGPGDSYFIKSKNEWRYEGDNLPATAKNGDIYTSGDYEYHYNEYYDGDRGDWVPDTDLNGWSARVIDSAKSSYSEPLTEIIGPVVSLASCYYGCTNVTSVPYVPESIEKLDKAYVGCTNLTGDYVLDFNPLSAVSVFRDTEKPIVIKGDVGDDICTQLVQSGNNENVTCGHNRVPEGCVYYDASRGVELPEGFDMPEVVEEGDIFTDEEYEYRYHQHYSAEKEDWVAGAAGWGVRVIDDSKSSYSDPRARIDGVAVTSLQACYYGCTNLIEAPSLDAFN